MGKKDRSIRKAPVRYNLELLLKVGGGVKMRLDRATSVNGSQQRGEVGNQVRGNSIQHVPRVGVKVKVKVNGKGNRIRKDRDSQ